MKESAPTYVANQTTSSPDLIKKENSQRQAFTDHPALSLARFFTMSMREVSDQQLN